MPKSFARANMCSGVLRAMALTDGMFSENWSAFRSAHRATLEVVRVGRGVAAAEIGADVHEHVARGHGPVVDADDVVERLEGRARLPEALADDVVLGLELGTALRRVVLGRPDVGDELAGLVVDRDQGAVADVLVLEVAHPVLVLVEAEGLGGRLPPVARRGGGRSSRP